MNRKTILYLGLLLIFAAVPFALGYYYTGMIQKFMIFGMFALSYNLIWGNAGLLSFGHSAFFAIGAYGVAVLSGHVTGAFSGYLAIAAGIMVPMLVGALIGYFVFYGKINGVYFGVITLAVAIVLQQVFVSASSLTGGDNGLFGYDLPNFGIPGVLDLSLSNEYVAYFTVLLASVVVIALCSWLTKSKFGRAVKAISLNEERMESLGYNTALYKMIMFAVSCGIAGLSGGLFTTVGFVSPGLFGLAFSTQVIVWVAVGGKGTLWGPFIGAFVISILETVLSGFFVDIWFLILGVALVAIVLFWPNGIAGSMRTDKWSGLLRTREGGSGR
jgi:urea transport system permease protein